MKQLMVFILFAIFFAPSFSQDAKQNVAEDEAVKIYEANKDAIVDIKVKVRFDSGFESYWGGSGFFIDKEGHIATAAHVVKIPGDEIQYFGKVMKVVSYEYEIVQFSKNRKYDAKFVGANHYSDTALMKAGDIDPADYVAVEIGDPDKLKEGERVYAIGSPFGLSNTLTAGKVSAMHRIIDFNYLEDFIQTDCPINPGNSGSPLFDSRGKVVAINDAHVRGADGIGFSVSMKLFNLDQLKKGVVEMPWLGIEAMVNNFPRRGTEQKPKFQDLAEINRLTGIDDPEILTLLCKLTYKDRWAIVTELDEIKTNGKFSPAKNAGIKRGDLITKINGKAVRNGMELRLTVLEIQLGKEIEIELIRVDKNGVPQNMTVKVTLEKKPSGKK